MAKRLADSQIDKNSAGVSDDEEPRPQVMASAEVMAKRKILQPKKRSFTPTSSAFGGLGAGNTTVTPGKAGDAEKSEKLKALSNKFMESVTKVVGAAGVADFRETCQKYLEYYRKIEDGSVGGDSSAGLGVGGVGSVVKGNLTFGVLNSINFGQKGEESVKGGLFGSSSSSGSSVSTGFAGSSAGTTTSLNTTTTAPTATNSIAAASSTPSNPFSGINFNQPKPTETSSQTPKNPFAGVSFSKPADLKPIVKLQPETVTVDSDSESEDEKPKDIKIAGPSFSLATKPTIKNSPFSFNKKPQAKEPDSDLDSEIEIKGPTFTFNKKILDPVFSLKKTETVTDPTTESSVTPAATIEHPVSAKPTAFSFTSKTDDKDSTPAPLTFSFGSSTSGRSTGSTAKATEPAPFSFGSTNAKAPAFSFGNSSTETKAPAFSFTANTASASNAQSSTPSGAPFSFGSSQKTESKPSVLFGAQNSDAKPSFLFGNTSADKPAFSFGTTSGTGAFGAKPFGQIQPAQSTPFGQTQPTQSSPATNNGEDSNEAEAEADIKFAPVASLGDKQVEATSGEENETAVLQQRAKLMLFDTANKAEPYKNLGVGDLKVLTANDGKSARVLLRADGALRVLLNVALKKELSYETLGNGSLVRVPAVDADGSITTYVLKVKTADDGQNLAKMMTECKK